MPDFFTAFYALVTAIADGQLAEGDVTYTEQSEDRMVTVMVTVRREPLSVTVAPDDE